MPLDPKAQETKNWLEIAKKDLEADHQLLSKDEFSAQVCFFAQQAAEKAIKGFLVWQQLRFKKEHDIRYLGNIALQKDNSLQSVIDEAATLSPFAVTFRYPGESVDPSVEDAKEALAIARKVLDAVIARLSF